MIFGLPAMRYRDCESIVVPLLPQVSTQLKVALPAGMAMCRYLCPLKKGGEAKITILSQSLSQNAILVTHNVREFERIVGLIIED
jgi:predicted nucleic acid-binding protein